MIKVFKFGSGGVVKVLDLTVPKNSVAFCKASWEIVYLDLGIFLRMEFGMGLGLNASRMGLSWF